MIYAIASQKGGTGKTTTSITLAAGLARKGKKVLLVDLDSQANASKVLLSDYKQIRSAETIFRTIIGIPQDGEVEKQLSPLPIHPTHNIGLELVPSHILLADTDMELTTALDHREARLKTELDKIKANYDFIFIDCPPALGWLTLNAFTAAEQVLVVVEPGYFELDSILQLQKTIMRVQRNFNPSLLLRGILLNKSDPTNSTKFALNALRETYGQLVLQTVIPRNTAIKEAHIKKTDIFSYDKHAYAAIAYANLLTELFAV
jgi:chromosome partitioning protein